MCLDNGPLLTSSWLTSTNKDSLQFFMFWGISRTVTRIVVVPNLWEWQAQLYTIMVTLYSFSVLMVDQMEAENIRKPLRGRRFQRPNGASSSKMLNQKHRSNLQSSAPFSSEPLVKLTTSDALGSPSPKDHRPKPPVTLTDASTSDNLGRCRGRGEARPPAPHWPCEVEIARPTVRGP